MAITLPDETQGELVQALKGYFRDERGEEIGDLQASFLLDFVLKEIGPSVYNQAVRDVQAHLSGVVSDLGATLYEPEYGHSTEARTRRRQASPRR
jgi:uncharacterized protein (DUF2164 family)